MSAPFFLIAVDFTRLLEADFVLDFRRHVFYSVNSVIVSLLQVYSVYAHSDQFTNTARV